MSGWLRSQGGFIDDPARGVEDINSTDTTGGRASFLVDADGQICHCACRRLMQDIESDAANTANYFPDPLRAGQSVTSISSVGFSEPNDDLVRNLQCERSTGTSVGPACCPRRAGASSTRITCLMLQWTVPSESRRCIDSDPQAGQIHAGIATDVRRRRNTSNGSSVLFYTDEDGVNLPRTCYSKCRQVPSPRVRAIKFRCSTPSTRRSPDTAPMTYYFTRRVRRRRRTCGTRPTTRPPCNSGRRRRPVRRIPTIR